MPDFPTPDVKQWARSSPIVNQVVLEHNPHPFVYTLSIATFSAELSSYNRDIYGPLSQKCFLSGPLQQSLLRHAGEDQETSLSVY